jgi:ferric iron reductase protein FhuF
MRPGKPGFFVACKWPPSKKFDPVNSGFNEINNSIVTRYNYIASIFAQIYFKDFTPPIFLRNKNSLVTTNRSINYHYSAQQLRNKFKD